MHSPESSSPARHSADTLSFEEALTAIRSRAQDYDRTGNWPAADLEDLRRAGVMRWAIAPRYGGDGIDSLELHLRYEKLAAASLSTALILTQRDSAVSFIATGPAALRDTLLPRLARHEIFATIGIAQLTTSRQGGAPALQARRNPAGGFILDGLIPWSTGPAYSDFIIAGAALEDGSGQILFALPRDLPGITIEPPMPLVAVRSSCTTAIRCQGVELSTDYLLRGPETNVLSARQKGTPVGQAFVAMGLCRAALDLIGEHRSSRAASLKERLETQWTALQSRMEDLSHPGGTPSSFEAVTLRGATSELTLRTTHAAVALYKGTALLDHHPAQRLAREALFLLVWSCPDPVIECTVDLLSRHTALAAPSHPA